MRAEFSSLEGSLFCPDDHTCLVVTHGAFSCTLCQRVFPIVRRNVIELLPSKVPADPAEFTDEYATDYRKEMGAHLKLESDAVAWGAEEEMPQNWISRRRRQVRAVVDLLKVTVKKSAVVCDLSAGAGYYTFALAREFETVLHCDLSVQNLSYAVRKAAEAGLDNILFVRADYFAVPFRSSLDAVVCLDSLIRGEEHERRLLSSITKALAPDGTAIVDFHNWWHNPLRRLGLLRENFGMNRSYTRAEVRRMLSECGIRNATLYPFYQEIADDSIKGRLLKFLLPPTRFVYLISPRRTV